jgi:acetylornithine deacetylase/succinyl-diaminopimelate desuccinylase-like protein
MPDTALTPEGLDSYVAGVRQEYERMLGGIVEIPTISADSEYKGDIERGADLALEYLQAFGASAEKVETPGNPVVLGKMLTDPANPTITVYNHLDVQPAQEPEWVRDPFSFHLEDGRYGGRGCTDDKGPALTALFAARCAIEKGVPINIHFIWELEEESGSPNFEHFMETKGDQLKTDSVLVSDTVWLSRDTPAIPYGLRGLQGARLILETGHKDAHSGLTGGAARNPIGELCQVISRCYDPITGRVNIPGFYDDVVPTSDEEMNSFLSSGFNVDSFMAAHGFKSLRTRDKRQVMERIWCQPTFEVHGIAGGYVGPMIKTVVPPRAEAKLSMRLVPRQDPLEVLGLLREYVKGINPDVQVETAGSLQPYLGEFSGAYPDAARSAIKFAFGKEPAFIREGGSIGAVVTMQDRLQVPIMFIGLSLPEHGYHAPNEQYDWGQASGGMKALAKYFSEVSAIGKA